jgi:hypothetical protein
VDIKVMDEEDGSKRLVGILFSRRGENRMISKIARISQNKFQGLNRKY